MTSVLLRPGASQVTDMQRGPDGTLVVTYEGIRRFKLVQVVEEGEEPQSYLAGKRGALHGSNGFSRP